MYEGFPELSMFLMYFEENFSEPHQLLALEESLKDTPECQWIITRWDSSNNTRREDTGASLVDQYLITLVHIVGFKIIKNGINILQVLGDEGFKVGVGRVVYKD